MKRLVWCFLFALLLPLTTHSYQAPDYRPSEIEKKQAAEVVLKDLTISSPADARRMARPPYQRMHHYPIPAREFWVYVADLKRALVALLPPLVEPMATDEANRLALITIETLYDISRTYRVIGWPRLQNALIKMGVREKGYCYHYAGDLQRALAQQTWAFFDVHWAEAFAGTRRESNALAITARGAPFGSGLVIDPWRTGSRPFWTTIQGDRWPWQLLGHGAADKNS